MGNQTAEDSFQRGLAALRRRGRERDATTYFRTALVLDIRIRKGSGRPRYRSYYGLCLALYRGEVRKGLALCRRAAVEEFYSPETLVNLARVEAKAGSRDRAHAVLVRAIRLTPADPEIRRHLDSLGMRRRPFLAFLPRGHPLNVAIGRYLHRRQQRRS